MVPEAGLEPARVSPTVFETVASANSATRARGAFAYARRTIADAAFFSPAGYIVSVFELQSIEKGRNAMALSSEVTAVLNEQIN